ncbi:unnamed protein product [Lupinus luteus]|uniref:Uncharacterized protein n=1 Tax=Lupinus luteus TaxID=3873 RepID=A0AAV1WQS0_LUPLU
MQIFEMKKGVVMMLVMIMLVLVHVAHAGDIASSPQDDQNVEPESKLTCRILCPIKCNPIEKNTISYGICIASCIKNCKNVLSKADINHCIAKHRATSFSKWKEVSNIDDRDGVDTYVNSFLEDCKSK